MGHNLIEAIQHEQARFRNVLIPAYTSVPTGVFALKMTIEPLLKASEKAIAEGDVVAMVRVLAEMREVED